MPIWPTHTLSHTHAHSLSLVHTLFATHNTLAHPQGCTLLQTLDTFLHTQRLALHPKSHFFSHSFSHIDKHYLSLFPSHTHTQLFSLSIPTKGINYSDAASSLFFNLTGTEISPFLRQIWFWQQQKLFIMFLCQFWIFFWGCCSAFPRLNESEEHNGAANHTSKSFLLVLVAACVTLLISSAKFGCLWVNKWTNKRTNEQTNKRTNE